MNDDPTWVKLTIYPIGFLIILWALFALFGGWTFVIIPCLWILGSWLND